MDIRLSNIITGGYYVCTPRWKVADREFADCHRLYFTREGSAEITCHGKTWKLDGGYVYLLPGYGWIKYRCSKQLTLDWLHFRADSVEMDLRVTQTQPGLRWPAKEWAFWKSLYTRIPEIVKTRSPELISRTQAMLLWLYSELLQRPESIVQSTDTPQTYAALKPALDFMNARFSSNPSLDDVAASVHLSPIYFHRCFAQTFHVTPHAYLQSKRMHAAWEILRGGDATVSQTAERLNFGSPFYFSRAFKRFFGVAPVDVRLGRAAQRP